jgi:hypothetical protein
VRYREARGGWFSYELKVTWEPVALVCTYRGAEGQTRTFDILVDGQKLVSESLPYHPTETFDREYPLPEAFWRDKEKITVRFQAPAGAATGAVFDVRTVAVAGVQ